VLMYFFYQNRLAINFNTPCFIFTKSKILSYLFWLARLHRRIMVELLQRFVFVRRTERDRAAATVQRFSVDDVAVRCAVVALHVGAATFVGSQLRLLNAPPLLASCNFELPKNKTKKMNEMIVTIKF
jgi:hypothetical protein